MNARDEGNWIAGSWTAPATGGWYEGPAEAEDRPARWPRSGGGDLDRALAAAERAARPWGRVSSRRRGELLEPAARTLAGDADTARLLGLALGLGPQEDLPACVRADADELEAVLHPWAEGLEEAGEPGGTTLVVADWREGLRDLAVRVLGELRRGSPVLLLADRCLPRAGAALARALAGCDLPVGTFALLHDGDADLLRAARDRAPRLPWWIAEGSDRAATALAGAPELPPLRTAPMARRSAAVLRADPPREAARILVRRAFGRSSTLSGQLPGQVGRVLCHELQLSELTAALLEELDRYLAVARPVPLVEPAVERHAREALALGLDEGACLISGGEPWGSSELDGPPAVAEGPAGTRFRPAVFTNVDPSLRFLRLRRPVPVLALVRVASDRAALELACELDVENPGPPQAAAPSDPERRSPMR